jgi:hypothetical protein
MVIFLFSERFQNPRAADLGKDSGEKLRWNHAFAVVFILLSLVLFSGCMYKIQSDLFIAKINGNGTFGWIQVIDSGIGTSVAETDEGGYLITGGSFPTNCGNPPRRTMVTPFLLYLSSQGKAERINNYTYANGEGLIASFQNADGTIIAVSESGTFLTLDRNGKLIKNTTPAEKPYSRAIRTADRGFLLAGNMWTPNGSVCRFLKTNISGSVVWKQDIRNITCDHGYTVIENGNTGKFVAGPFIQSEKPSVWSVRILSLDERNASITDLDGLTSLTHYPQLSEAIAKQETIIFFYSPPGAQGSIENKYSSGYSTTSPGYPTVISRQDVFSVNQDGRTITNRTIYGSNGLVYFESGDSGYLSIYNKVKGSAVYYRLVETDGKGNRLWDEPFLTMRYRPAPTDLHDNIIIRQIIPTSDQGYIIMGQRQRTSDC